MAGEFADACRTANQWSNAVFDSYRNKYENVRMKREDGILEVALHSAGGPLVFNGDVHEAWVMAFRDIGDDPGLALEGISAAQVAWLNAQKAKG